MQGEGQITRKNSHFKAFKNYIIEANRAGLKLTFDFFSRAKQLRTTIQNPFQIRFYREQRKTPRASIKRQF